MRHYSKSHFFTLIISFVTILSKTPPKQNTFCRRGILTHGTYHEGIYFNPPDYQSNRDIGLRILFKPSWLRQNRVLKLKIGSFIKGLRKNTIAVVPPEDLASVRVEMFPDKHRTTYSNRFDFNFVVTVEDTVDNFEALKNCRDDQTVSVVYYFTVGPLDLSDQVFSGVDICNFKEYSTLPPSVNHVGSGEEASTISFITDPSDFTEIHRIDIDEVRYDSDAPTLTEREYEIRNRTFGSPQSNFSSSNQNNSETFVKISMSLSISSVCAVYLFIL